MNFSPRRKFGTFKPAVLAVVSAIVIAIFQASTTVAFVWSTENQQCFPKHLYNRETMGYPKTSSKKSKADKNIDEKTTTTGNNDEDFQPKTWNPLRLMVMKLSFTELRFTSPLNYEERDGVYNCAYCGLDLFDSDGKYDSGSGWPSFWRSTRDGNVAYKQEWDGRLECLCANKKCSAHLGHVFLDGPLPNKVNKELFDAAPPSDPRGRNPDGYLPRFCVNGASLKFEKKTGDDAFPFAK